MKLSNVLSLGVVLDETAIVNADFALGTPVFGFHAAVDALQLCGPRLHKMIQAVKPYLVRNPVMKWRESAWASWMCMTRTTSKACLSNGSTEGQQVHGIISGFRGSSIEMPCLLNTEIHAISQKGPPPLL